MQRGEEMPRCTFVSGFSLWLSFCSYHIFGCACDSPHFLFCERFSLRTDLRLWFPCQFQMEGELKFTPIAQLCRLRNFRLGDL